MLVKSLLIASLSVSSYAGVLNSSTFDTSLFRMTTFVSRLPFPDSVLVLSDGSVAILSSPGYSQSGSILRFTDVNHTGVADKPGTALYTTSPGPLTGLIRIGNYYAVGDYGSHRITLLRQAHGPSSPMTPVANLNFNYGTKWDHNTIGIAARPAPGVAGSYDLVFNVGSQIDNTASTATVALTETGFSKFPSAKLKGAALYAITIDEAGSQPSASNLRAVAVGVRNSFGMSFQQGTGNFYFSDNAIDAPLTNGEPPQADELNFIAAANFGVSKPPNFGFPTCYIQYITNDPIGSGCTQPLVAFQPIPSTYKGAETEGPTELAFAPTNFPSGFSDGIFSGFNGEGIGVPTDEAGLVYYDFSTKKYLHFIESSNPAIGNITGVSATSDALFISDFGRGNVYEVTKFGLSRNDLGTGLNPRGVATGDFNNDGKPDIAVVNSRAATVSILLGNGNGTFQAHKDYATGASPIFVTTGDFNADGKLDLAIANFSSHRISILLGKGDGTFENHVDYTTEMEPASIAVGDFNKDGKPDLAVANFASNTVSILLGQGDSTFRSHALLATGISPISVEIGDVNGDGNLDLVTSNPGSDTISVFLGHGNGSFNSQLTFATGSSPRTVVLADFNGDGKLDAAVPNYAADSVSVLLGNGDGTFQHHVDHATGPRPFSLLVVDLNGDGKPDLAVADSNCSTTCAANGYVSVLFNDGNGAFRAHRDFATGPQPLSLAAGTFRDDGLPDLAVTNYRSNSVSLLLQ